MLKNNAMILMSFYKNKPKNNSNPKNSSQKKWTIFLCKKLYYFKNM